jgi:hypothetical protein
MAVLMGAIYHIPLRNSSDLLRLSDMLWQTIRLALRKYFVVLCQRG